MTQATFYGFDGHVRVTWPGAIVSAPLAPADQRDRRVNEYDLLGGGSLMVGDTNYWNPVLKEMLANYGLSPSPREDRARSTPDCGG